LFLKYKKIFSEFEANIILSNEHFCYEITD